MKVSFKGDYALKIILDLSLNYGHGIAQIKDISKRQDIPEKFLEQIITILKSAKYVKTTRGPKGGVTLSKPPSQITMGEIIRLMEGPTSPITCVSKSEHAKCNFEKRCAFRGYFEEIRDRVNEVADNTTFQDIADKARKLHSYGVLDYSI
ncbi:MAG: Rrf2 family transcriptional regulator [Elusimicrobiota bacterium]